ncbi:MAG TPA: hypothetical protein VF469_08670 [Kofleriaceae bacterium]
MNRDAKTPATLIALARTRRMQRALAHAYLHRDAPLLTLHSSLGYMTTTARVTGDAAEVGHRMTVLGIAGCEGVAYVVEDIGGDSAPLVYRLYLRGPRQGHLVPLHAWYDQGDSAPAIRARIATLVPLLEPVLPTAPEAWMLSTRIVQRRALRVAGPGECGSPPIRKFALQLVVEPVRGMGPSGRTTVTAFLSPHAQLTEIWSLARAGADPAGATCDLAIARVTFTGIPSGTGLTKDTVVLLTAGLPQTADIADSYM